jgi:ribonucleotide monophosphatase NagD (HAD superfamily)
MAKAEGWISVLVFTGVVGVADEIADGDEPDLVLASLADLPEALQS